MAEQTNTISRGQLEALKAGIRAAAEANPSRSQNKAQRCAEFTRTVCSSFGVDRLAELPASCFTEAMQTVAKLTVPVRQAGEAEASLKASKESLAPALADLNRTRNSIAAYRRAIAQALVAPMTDIFQSQGPLAVAVQDTVGLLLAEPFQAIDAQLMRAHEIICVLASRLPSIGRALDELKARTTTPAEAFPNMGAD